MTLSYGSLSKLIRGVIQERSRPTISVCIQGWDGEIVHQGRRIWRPVVSSKKQMTGCTTWNCHWLGIRDGCGSSPLSPSPWGCNSLSTPIPISSYQEAIFCHSSETSIGQVFSLFSSIFFPQPSLSFARVIFHVSWCYWPTICRACTLSFIYSSDDELSLSCWIHQPPLGRWLCICGEITEVSWKRMYLLEDW